MSGLRLSLALLFVVPSLGFAQTDLTWKFAVGDVFRLQRDARDTQITTLKGQTLKQEIRSKWTYRFEVVEIGAATTVLQAAIESVSVAHAGGPANVDNKIHEKLKGAAFTLDVTRRGEIVRFDGYDKALERLSDGKETLAKLMRQQIPEGTIRQEFEQMLTVLPDMPVMKGSPWDEKPRLLFVAPLGRFVASGRGTVAEIDRAGNFHLAGTLTGKFQRPDPPAEFFRVVGGSLSLDRGVWTCVFDNDRGRPISQKVELTISGELTVEIVGTTAPAAIEIRRDVATRLLTGTKE